MFCPQCGTSQSDELKFCKTCGANLQAVRQAAAVREPGGEGFDWSKTWVADMFRSEGERKRRAEELERLRGLTPEVKRYNEIKGGVITASIGLGVMLFLYFFMQAVILGGKVPYDTSLILSRVWLAGIIPLFVGLGLIVNGAFVSKRQVAAMRREEAQPATLPAAPQTHALPAADTSEFVPAGFSVTEGTTRHLSNAGAAPTDAGKV
jgi:hypothetical protein